MVWARPTFCESVQFMVGEVVRRPLRRLAQAMYVVAYEIAVRL